MAQALLIAEKPSLMREIKAVYESHASEFSFGIDFTSQSGHLVTLKLPREIEPDMKGRDWNNLPYVPEQHGGWQYKIIQEKKTGKFLTPEERYKDIKAKLHSGRYQFVIHAGDPDQEGELLVNLVLQEAGNGLPVKRFWTNDLTEKHILHALKNLKDDAGDPMLTNLMAAALGRQHSDYRVGMNLSEAASLKMNANIAVGRVMTPILAIVCKREDEIENFKPKTVYGVEADYEAGFSGNLYNPELQDEEKEEKEKGLVWFDTAAEADELIRSLGRQAVVKSFTAKQVKTKAPKLFKLSTIQTAAGHAYGYSADKVLSICQSLYEKKYQSYPRTDCEYLSSDEDFLGILGALNKRPEFNPWIKTISSKAIAATSKDKRWINDKALEDSGHSALRPTTIVPDPASLSTEEWNVYQMIAKRFIAIFLPPIIQNATELITSIGGHLFRSTGKALVDKGYSTIFDMKFTDTAIPEQTEGTVLPVRDMHKTEKTSTCPKRYTSPDLIAACENPLKFLEDKELKKLGKDLKIGTPATRSSIIRKLINIQYLKEEKKGKTVFILPTPNGRGIIQNLAGMMICRVDMTGLWEEELENVRQGKESLPQLEASMTNGVAAMVEEIRKADMKAAITGQQHKETYDCTWQGRPARFARVWGGHRFTDEECQALTAGKDITFQTTLKSGDPCKVYGKLAVQTYKGKQFLGFQYTSWENLNPDKQKIPITWNGEKREFTPVFSGRRFTEEEIAKLARGEDITFQVKGKSGDTYSVKGKLEDYTFNGHKVFGFKAEEYQNNDPSKEYAEGTWKKKKVRFKRVWAGYRFTDDEVKRLLNDEVIQITVKNKRGDDWTLQGRLKNGVYNKHKYVGFARISP